MGDKFMIQRILPGYFFTLECLFLYFLFFVFYTFIGEVPSPLSFLAILFIAQMVLHFGLKQKSIKGSLPFIGALLCGVTAFLLQFSPMSVLMCTIFLFFRIQAFLKNSSLWKEDRSILTILFFCSGIIILLEAWTFEYLHMNWLFGTMIVFTICISVGSYLQHVEDSKANRYIVEFVGVLGIVALITGILSPLMPAAKWLFKNIFEGTTLVFSVLLHPLFFFIETNKLRPPGVKLEDEDDPAGKGKDIVELNSPFEYIPSWAWIMLLVIILVVIWLIVRELKMDNSFAEKENVVKLKIDHTPASISIENKTGFFRVRDPHEYVRKLFYQFQFFAENHGVGRYEHETIREWFERVGFQKNEDLFHAYECVRYGGEVIHKQDAKRYENMIREIKLEVKERNKKDKEA
jgi:hypothetical protein